MNSNTNYNSVQYPNLSNNYSNFDEVFAKCYEISDTITKIVMNNPVRKQFFCEKIIKKFNLDPNTHFTQVKELGNTYTCYDKDGKEVILLFADGNIVQFNSKEMGDMSDNMIKMSANEFIENDGNGNRMVVNFDNHRIGFMEANQGDFRAHINVLKATCDQRKQFENAMSTDMYNFYQQGKFSNFFVNELYQNRDFPQRVASPMFNYCWSNGFFKNYTDNLQTFTNEVYNQNFRFAVMNAQRQYNVMSRQEQKQMFDLKNFNGLNNKMNINRNQNMSIGSAQGYFTPINSNSNNGFAYMAYQNNNMLNGMRAHNNINYGINNNINGQNFQSNQNFINNMRNVNNQLVQQQMNDRNAQQNMLRMQQQNQSQKLDNFNNDLINSNILNKSQNMTQTPYGY